MAADDGLTISGAYLVGTAPKHGEKCSSKDALGVTNALTKTQYFSEAMKKPEERDRFEKAIKLKQEMALARNDKTMFDLLGGFLDAVSGRSNETANQTTTGSKFDTNNLFAV